MYINGKWTILADDTRVRQIGNDNTGTIVGYSRGDYVVQWDHLSYKLPCPADQLVPIEV